jgi:hypothetical protein
MIIRKNFLPEMQLVFLLNRKWFQNLKTFIQLCYLYNLTICTISIFHVFVPKIIMIYTYLTFLTLFITIYLLVL